MRNQCPVPLEQIVRGDSVVVRVRGRVVAKGVVIEPLHYNHRSRRFEVSVRPDRGITVTVSFDLSE